MSAYAHMPWLFLFFFFFLSGQVGFRSYCCKGTRATCRRLKSSTLTATSKDSCTPACIGALCVVGLFFSLRTPFLRLQVKVCDVLNVCVCESAKTIILPTIAGPRKRSERRRAFCFVSHYSAVSKYAWLLYVCEKHTKNMHFYLWGQI